MTKADVLVRPGGVASRREVGPLCCLPKAPVLDWSDLAPGPSTSLASIDQLPHLLGTTSGRAALYMALVQLDMPPGSGVLVPTYHCPTMVAPVLEAGHEPIFYPLAADGQPLLEEAVCPRGRVPRAAIVAHYFGLARDLSEVRRWCDSRGVALVEDCAHSFFGMAGTRPVGRWGCLATASLSKFFPVPEGGLLASSTRPIRPVRLQPPGLRAQSKAAWDVIDIACSQGRLAGLAHLLRPLRAARGRQALDAVSVATESVDAAAIIAGCDMGRIGQAQSLTATLLHRLLSTGRLVDRRRQNYETLARALAGAPSSQLMSDDLPHDCAPYVLPLWLEDTTLADRVYTQLRAERLPVFRWDRAWPGTPRDPQDFGAAWGRQVLQVLCHQSLSAADQQFVADRIVNALHHCG
jgi:dTDP-4-amino-4,6-dideoxygalactose transaminase